MAKVSRFLAAAASILLLSQAAQADQLLRPATPISKIKSHDNTFATQADLADGSLVYYYVESYDDSAGNEYGNVDYVYTLIDDSTGATIFYHYLNCSGTRLAGLVAVDPNSGTTTLLAPVTLDPANPDCASVDQATPVSINVTSKTETDAGAMHTTDDDVNIVKTPTGTVRTSSHRECLNVLVSGSAGPATGGFVTGQGCGTRILTRTRSQ